MVLYRNQPGNDVPDGARNRRINPARAGRTQA